MSTSQKEKLRERDRERERFFIHWFTPQMTTKAWAKLKARPSPELSHEAQAPELSSTAVPGHQRGARQEMKMLAFQAAALPLCYNTGP